MIVLAACVVNVALAQDTTTLQRTAPAANMGGNDHLLLQLGYTTWMGKPDSINTGGFSRTFNIYFMFAFPFKTNPKMSVAVGAGLATDHILFDKTTVGITDPTATLVFKDLSDTSHFDKYKVSTSYLEAPVELRFTSKPNDDKHSVKAAIGVKVATMLSAWTKGVEWVDKNGNTLNDYTQKLKSKRFFNTTRLSVTSRIGYGKFSLFGSYALSPLLKEGVGPTMRPMTIGLTLSGL
jgi:hypothetical protein